MEYTTLDTPALNGGSAILGYDLWRDDGQGGDPESLYGSKASTESILALTYTDYNVAKAVTYRYRYRARNINGWGDFSVDAYLFASSVPSQPPPPALLSVDDTSIALRLYTSPDTGGSDLLSYELWIDGGTENSPFVQVTSYSGSISTLTHTLTVAADSLVAGRFYTIKFRSLNPVGYSQFSEVLRVGLGAEPPALTTLAANLDLCTSSSVAMTWTLIDSSVLQLPVLGYVVQMIDPVSDEWVDVYDASTNPDANAYIWYGAITGEIYTFRAFGVNFNGRTTQIGNQVSILACGLPRYMDQPLYVNSSRTNITLSWLPPQDDGGCAISDYAVYRD